MIATLADFDETHHAFRNTCRSRIEASWSFGPILLRGPAPPQSRSSISIFRFSPRRLSRSGHVDMILPGRGPAWESVPCVVGHGRIIRPRVRTSVGPGRPSERRGRVAGRELAARPAVDPGGGRAAVPCVPVPEVSQTWRSSSTASRPGSLQIPGASVLARNDRGASGRSGTPGPVPSGLWPSHKVRTRTEVSNQHTATEVLTMGITHSTVSPHRSVDATGRALPMTDEEIHAQAVEIARGLDALDDMGDEDEQRQTLSALMKAIDEEPLSPRRRFGNETRVPRLRPPRLDDQPAR